jgi:hypothetical protein
MPEKEIDDLLRRKAKASNPAACSIGSKDHVEAAVEGGEAGREYARIGDDAG